MIDKKLLEKISIEFSKLKDRVINPNGSFDKKGRFYIDKKFDCCKGIRIPSAAYPYSEMLHARSLIHVVNSNGLESAVLPEVKKYVNSLKPKVERPKNYCYKKVAVNENEKFCSLYDSSFKWILGKKEKVASIKINNGFYGFEDIKEAISFYVVDYERENNFDSFYFDKFVVLKCEVSKEKNHIRCTNSKTKYEYQWLKPVEVVFEFIGGAKC